VDLLRAWARQLAAAAVAAACVPLAIACALVAVAFTGAFGSLGSLGEIFSGPRAAPAIALAPVASPRPPAGSARPLHLAVALAHAHSTADANPPAPVRRASAQVPAATVPAAQVLLGAPTFHPAKRAHMPPRPPPAPPSAIDRVGGLANSLTDTVPAPVGSVAARTVQSVGGAVPPPPNVTLP
jgi:hypothetical protein